MKRRSLLLCLIICIFASCSRDSFSISSVNLFPTVVATHGASINSTLVEGLAVVVLAHPLEKGEQYQLSISPPSISLVWEVAVIPFKAADLWYIGTSDLLLPPDAELESGLYEIEMYLPDGRRFNQGAEYIRSKQALSAASFQVSALPPLEWEGQSDTWTLRGYAHEGEKHVWRYTFYDANDKVLSNKESSALSIDVGNIKESTAYIIASRFDDALGVFFIVRTLFT